MKAKKTVAFIGTEYLTSMLQKACEQLRKEENGICETMAQLDKAGKYQLSLKDEDMERINRFFRGKRDGLRMGLDKLLEIQRYVWEIKQRKGSR